MATPDFVLKLREKVGHAPLWMPGCTAIVLRGDLSLAGTARSRELEVLVVQRADTGAWTPVTGIVDPGEEPADAAVREVWEEAAVRAHPVKMISTEVVGPLTYANGDVATYLDSAFLMVYDSSTPCPARLIAPKLRPKRKTAI